MSVNVQLHGPGQFGDLDFERPIWFTTADGRGAIAEQFAQELERIAADLRRMFPAGAA